MVAGEHSLSNASELEQNSNVDSYLMHADYSPITLENDIALIYVRLSTVITRVVIYHLQMSLAVILIFIVVCF